MALAKRYRAGEVEPALEAFWEQSGVHRFERDGVDRPVFAIDTPPPTVSGRLHLGHCYSYSHTDFVARYRRMRGEDVFYPMGFDDNGLPTERLVERRIGRRADEVSRAEFIALCADVGAEAVNAYAELWRRLGLSIDWRHTYRTIGASARRIAQRSFLDLVRRGIAYRAEAPVLWCPECRTAIAQAELADLERETTFHTLAFRLDDGTALPVATTRPELLGACVAVFVHPDDARFAALAGRSASVPLYGTRVPVLADTAADPEKGTGVVMCCTFGDTTDVAWWRAHDLPLRQVVDGAGRLTGPSAGPFAGLALPEARARIVAALSDRGELVASRSAAQAVRVHERCDTPVEFLVTNQWFIRVLDRKPALLEAGRRVRWHPEHMGRRYAEWVENLSWDWCISRQRTYGVAFPLWVCADCADVVLADPAALPVDPERDPPPRPCACGSGALAAGPDVMDTWATSSLTPQIAGRWLDEPDLHERVFPFALRPQAHEIIRTWAFYTVVMSHYHFGRPPWRDVMISGWGIAPAGAGKVSKSRGGDVTPPGEMIDRYSADAVRYWAASTATGKDAVIDEEKIAQGQKLVTKLWNVCRFAERFLGEGKLRPPGDLSPADRWILAATQGVVVRATEALEAYDYAGAKGAVETLFWRDLADNYLEMAKGRLYDAGAPGHAAAAFTLDAVLRTILQLFAPFLPHVCDAAYRELYAERDGVSSIHAGGWPEADAAAADPEAIALGTVLVDIATAVRRYKSERSLSLGAELRALVVWTDRDALRDALRAAGPDLRSVTRARAFEVADRPPAAGERLDAGEGVGAAVVA